MSLETSTLDSNPASILINGNNSQTSTGFTSNDHTLNALVPHLGLDGLPRGRLLHHLFLRNCPLMRVPRCEPVRESILRETRKWSMPDGPFDRWRPAEEMEVEQQHPSPPFPDAHQQIIAYSDEDYYRLLMNDEWSKQETDRLVYFWNTLGGRFVIITDRYNYGLSDPSSFRPAEELKERLVEVMNRLNEARGKAMHLSYNKGNS